MQTETKLGLGFSLFVVLVVVSIIFHGVETKNKAEIFCQAQGMELSDYTLAPFAIFTTPWEIEQVICGVPKQTIETFACEGFAYCEKFSGDALNG